MESGHTESDFLRPLQAYVRRRMSSSADADDVVQTVLLRMVEAQQSPVRASVHAWMRTVARNAIVDFHRARIRALEEFEEDAQAIQGTQADAPEIVACLAPLLAGLSPADRSLLERVDLHGESQADIARELSVSLSTVKSRTQRARERLKSALISRCEFERDGLGMPIGPVRCRTESRSSSCDCETDPSREVPPQPDTGECTERPPSRSKPKR